MPSLDRRTFLAAAFAPSPAAPSFGLVADVQYADQPAAGPRAYRDSMAKLEACAAWFQSRNLRFVLQLGDLVDGGASNLARILPVWRKSGPRRYHVLGNHDAALPRPALLRALGLKRAWRDFTLGDWRMIILDCTDASVMAGAASRPEGEALLAEARRAASRNAQEWNGGLGRRQLAWLRDTLADAAKKRQRALVFCHQPLLAAACRPDHLLLNHLEVVRLLEDSRTVAACFAGHDHRGGSAVQNGIHYITLRGLVEHTPQDSAIAVRLEPAALRLQGMNGREVTCPLRA